MPNARDYTNQIFGTLRAIKPTGLKNCNNIVWELKCLKCNEKVFNIPRYLHDNSCCKNKLCKIGISKDDLAGTKFGHWTVINYIGTKGGTHVWNCKCICGRTKKVQEGDLKNKKSRSCGCGGLVSGAVSWNGRWHLHLKGCKSRKLENELTKELYVGICSQNCIYCGVKPMEWNIYIKNRSTLYKLSESAIQRAWIKTNGVDRVDNDIGYLLSNSVSCCADCNRFKSGMTIYEWCSAIERFQPDFTNKILKKLKNARIKIPKETV